MGKLPDIVHNYNLHSTKEFTFYNINNEKMFKHMIYVLHYLDGLKLIRFESIYLLLYYRLYFWQFLQC